MPQSSESPSCRSRLLTALAALLALWSAVRAFEYSGRYPGDDFYLHWCVSRVAGDAAIGDIYGEAGRAAVAAEARAVAEQSGASHRLDELIRRYPEPTIWASPFLYASLAPFVTDDYDADYSWYRWWTVLGSAFAILALARIAGWSWWTAWLGLAALLEAYAPLGSVLRTGNVSQLQLVGIAVFCLLQRRPTPGAGQIAEFGSGFLAGIGLAFKPNLAIAGALLVFTRIAERRSATLIRECAGGLVGVIVALTVSYACFGSLDPWISWAEHLATFIHHPPGIQLGNYSLAFELSRWLGVEVSTPLTLVLSVAAAALLWRRRRFEGPPSPRRDLMAIALGCQVTLLAAPLAWLHYYNLALPMALLLLATPGVASRVVTGIAIAAVAVEPMTWWFASYDSGVWAALSIGGATALLITFFWQAWRHRVDTPESPAARWPIVRVAPLALLIATLVVFANTLHNPFILDDQHRIVENPEIRRVAPISRHFVDPSTSATLERIQQYRPLLPLSLSLDHAWHGYELPGYHLGNLLFHWLAATLVFLILRELLFQCHVRSRDGPAFFAALCFAVHPVSGFTINYVSARDLVMMQAFLLAGVLAYVRMRRIGTSPLRWLGVLSLVGASLLAKTNAVVFPALVLAYEWTIGGASPRSRPSWRCAGIAALPVIGYFGFTELILGFSDTATVRAPRSPWEYALVQVKLHATQYAANFAWPWPIRLGPEALPVEGILDPGWLAGLALILGSLLIAWRCARSRPFVAFAVLGYWILIAPTSSFLPFHHAATHYRPYPGSWLLWGGVAILGWALPRTPRTVAAVCAIAYFAFASLHLNTTWRTHESAWRHSVTWGGDELAHFNYARSLPAGDPRIQVHLDEAIRRFPHHVMAHIQSGIHLVDIGREDEGLDRLRATAERYPDWSETHYWLGRTLSRLSRRADAISAYERAIQIDADRPEYHRALGLELQLADRLADSLGPLNACLALESPYLDAEFLRGYALQMTGRPTTAIAAYRSFLESQPDHVQARFNLAYALMESGEPAAAIPEFLAVLERRPGYTECRTHLVTCYEAIGAPAMADAYR